MQNELLQQQMDNLRRKERILEDEHSNLSNWVAVEGNKPMQQHEQQVMDYFPFFEDQPADTLLQLAAPVLPHFHPYLHLAQPNFQHSQEP
ncbi:PREDICTED: MADS-box protein AeAP3-2-like [Lupinus angustifolius]|uniref:MADS-box protein AeAP3-2-like n=1 Tax=Lupinus angustifolius TaxID=3871 RepID=UPI00092EF8F0|nr:PREDICTED: MADS-box protein AeAP3-2-like [Lupinus angustifolius]